MTVGNWIYVKFISKINGKRRKISRKSKNSQNSLIFWKIFIQISNIIFPPTFRNETSWNKFLNF